MKNALLIPTFLVLAFAAVCQVSEFIHVDQFGYLVDAEKVAVLSNPVEGYNASESYTAPAVMEVRSAVTDEVWFSGAPLSWNSGATHDKSGDQGWWFDFSEFDQQGDYYVYDPENDEKSAVFSVSNNPYREVLKAAGRMFYYNRCNAPKEAPYADPKWTDATNFLNPLQDANCRYIYEPGNAALEKDLSGGWFDAGDYNKYVTFTYPVLHDLLGAYEENPNAFDDSWDIPESGNGIPDLLDEVKWELDWLLKMANSDGSVHIKMGNQNYAENTNSPPSQNNDPRFYGPTCTSAAATVASVFARASMVYEQISGMESYAQELEESAKASFDYVLPFLMDDALETECDDGSIVAGDADVDAVRQLERMFSASVYLWERTGAIEYQQFIGQAYEALIPLASNYWGPEDMYAAEVLLHYSMLPGANTTVKDAILSSVGTDVSNNFNYYFGWNERDLYRAFVSDWSYYWGSNQVIARTAILNYLIAEAEVGDADALWRKAAEQVHYFHGVNPLGLVYLSNMYTLEGDRCVNEIYHTWFYDGTEYDHALNSPKGPPPGYLTGGANAYFSVPSISPPSNQPDQKSYLDFNTGWPDNSWEISEPAIYYQAAYIRLLANYVNGQNDPVANQNLATKKRLQIFPNPSTGIVHLELPNSLPYQWRILSSAGEVVREGSSAGLTTINLSEYPAGVYFYEVQVGDGLMTGRLVLQ